MHLVWELVRITDALFSHIDDSGEMQSNFVKNGIDDWPKKAIAVGAEGGHFLRSAKGAWLCAQAKGHAVPALLQAQLTNEAGGTTTGIMIMLLLFIHPIAGKSKFPNAELYGHKVPTVPVCVT